MARIKKPAGRKGGPPKRPVPQMWPKKYRGKSYVTYNYIAQKTGLHPETIKRARAKGELSTGPKEVFGWGIAAVPLEDARRFIRARQVEQQEHQRAKAENRKTVRSIAERAGADYKVLIRYANLLSVGERMAVPKSEGSRALMLAPAEAKRLEGYYAGARALGRKFSSTAGYRDIASMPKADFAKVIPFLEFHILERRARAEGRLAVWRMRHEAARAAGVHGKDPGRHFAAKSMGDAKSQVRALDQIEARLRAAGAEILSWNSPRELGTLARVRDIATLDEIDFRKRRAFLERELPREIKVVNYTIKGLTEQIERAQREGNNALARSLAIELNAQQTMLIILKRIKTRLR